MIFTLDTVLEISLAVALALIVARFLGYIFDKLKQPAVIGEIIAGIILGGFGLGLISKHGFSIFNWSFSFPNLDYTGEYFSLFAGLGILFFMFISGLEVNISKFKGMEKASFFIAVGGVVLPLILGFIAGMYFGFSWQASTVIGLILVATSVGVTVRTLMDLRLLSTYPGIAILGAAVIDDVIGIILLTFLLGTDSMIAITFKMLLYFLIFAYLGVKFIGRVLNLGEKIQLPKAFLGISISIMLIYSFFAYQSGITGIIGAFLAGTLIGNTVYSNRVIDDVKTIGYGIFIPLFFVWVGASIDLTAFLTIGPFALVVIAVGVLGKIVGCSVGAKLAGMKISESIEVGVGMVPRMEMALITVSIAIIQGVIVGEVADKILATTILLTIVTTLIA
ncbi:MAG: cation:proton antiporter, partial [Thermoplasmatota archaeon]